MHYPVECHCQTSLSESNDRTEPLLFHHWSQWNVQWYPHRSACHHASSSGIGVSSCDRHVRELFDENGQSSDRLGYGSNKRGILQRIGSNVPNEYRYYSSTYPSGWRSRLRCGCSRTADYLYDGWLHLSIHCFNTDGPAAKDQRRSGKHLLEKVSSSAHFDRNITLHPFLLF